MTCDGLQAVFIAKGQYGKTPLDGLAVARFVQSPEGKSMFESFGNWNFDNVYIDERATEQQRTALREIAAHFFPLGAKKREFHYVPIARKIEGSEHVITVGEIGTCSGHHLEGGYAGAPRIVNPPLSDPTPQTVPAGRGHEADVKGCRSGLAVRELQLHVQPVPGGQQRVRQIRGGARPQNGATDALKVILLLLSCFTTAEFLPLAGGGIAFRTAFVHHPVMTVPLRSCN